MMIRALLLCCLLAFPVAAKKPVKPPSGPPDGVTWTRVGTVSGVVGNYTPPVIMGGSQIRVYANTNGSTDGDWWMRVGSWSSVGSASMVMSRNQITDLPPDAAGNVGIPFIRTTAAVRGASGAWYGLLHVGASYPSNIGYRPAWTTSADGVTWQYQHMIAIDGVQRYVYSSSAALIVQEEKPATLDTVNPANNRFLAFEDAFSIDGVSKRLVMIYSADGHDWRFWRDGSGNVIDIWPAELASDGPVFPTAVRDAFGYHIIAADKWPTSAHRHLWSCDGRTWRVIETNADTYVAGKGTNLVVDAGTIHALTSGAHHTLTARAFPC